MRGQGKRVFKVLSSHSTLKSEPKGAHTANSTHTYYVITGTYIVSAGTKHRSLSLSPLLSVQREHLVGAMMSPFDQRCVIHYSERLGEHYEALTIEGSSRIKIYIILAMHSTLVSPHKPYKAPKHYVNSEREQTTLRGVWDSLQKLLYRARHAGAPEERQGIQRIGILYTTTARSCPGTAFASYTHHPGDSRQK